MVTLKSLLTIKSRLFNKINISFIYRQLSTKLEQSSKCTYSLAPFEDVLECTDKKTEDILRTGLEVYDNFITEDEEKSLYDEVQNHLKRLRYENSHWDDVSLEKSLILSF